MSILIRDGFLVTMNATRETFARGYVVVDDDGRIALAGPIEHLPAGAYDEIIDAEDMIIVPGLINALQRPAQALLRGFTHHEGYELGLTARDIAVSARVSALDMLRSGTTCCVAHTDTEDETLNLAIGEALHGSGLRSTVAGRFDITRAFEGVELAFAGLRQLLTASARRGGGRSNLALALNLDRAAENRPAAERWVTAAYQFACENDLIIYAPVGIGGSNQTLSAGRSDVMYLMEMGVLDLRWLLSNAVDANDTDIRLMRESGCGVVVTPVSEALQGLGIGRYSAMMGAGINCALGSDGALSGASADMMEQVKACLILQNANLLDPTALSPALCLEMATIRAARALGLDHVIGSIEPGKRADIAIFDLRGPHVQVAHRPISNLVCSGSRRDVHAVLIDGKVLMRDDSLVDTGAAKAAMTEAQAVSRRLIDSGHASSNSRIMVGAVH